MKVRQSAKTDVGLIRDHNEDCYGFGPVDLVGEKGYLIVVCDGMGGHAAGEVASRMAVDTIIDGYYSSDDPDRAQVLEQSFVQANERIYNQGHGSMGTTGVAALLYEDALHIANVGDSRAYLIRDGELRQLSQDHSFVAEQVAAGYLTPDQARHSIHRNVITRALGYQPGVVVDLTRWLLRPGDLVLLSSDGLHSLVEDNEISVLAAQSRPEDLVEQLVALANRRGGSDNITVAVAQVDDVESYRQSPESAAVQRIADGATTQTLVVDTAPTLPDTQPPADTQPPPIPSNRHLAAESELPLRLWGALLAGITALTLIGFALWTVDSNPSQNPSPTMTLVSTAVTPRASPIASQPALNPALTSQPASPSTTASPVPTTTPLRTTPTPTSSS